MRQLISGCLLIICFFTELGILFVETAEIKNAVRNGWQPLLNYEKTGANPSPSNYPYTSSYYEPERDRSYNSQTNQRKLPQKDPSNQHEYTPPSILGSFSIFSHSVSNYQENEPKKPRETINKNEYDFLMPPPRQTIEPYQKIKMPADLYSGPSQYRDIYTPLTNHFTFLPPNGAPSFIRKHPQPASYREEIYPLRQYPTSIDSHKVHHQPHQKLPPWMHPHRENIDPYHGTYRQHPSYQNEPSIETGNRYYTQLNHPPLFNQPHEHQKPLKIKNQSDHAALSSGNFYTNQPSTSPRNELPPTTTDSLQLIPQHIEHYLFDQNSLTKPPPPTDFNYYKIKHRENITTNWPISTTINSKYSELLPNYNEPIEFKPEDNLNLRLLPDKILPAAPTKEYETPEAISLKHFNEQQYLLQQQLLERDRKKLEEFNKQNDLSRLIDKPVESSTSKQIIQEFSIYEPVKLTYEDRVTPHRPTIASESIKSDDNSSTSHAGKRKRVNNNRIIITSEASDYDRQVAPSDYNSLRTSPPDSATEIRPATTTPSEPVRKSSQRPTTQHHHSTTLSELSRKSPQSTTQYQIPSTTPIPETPRLPTRTRAQSRKPTRRRRPAVEVEQIISSIQPELSTFTTESLSNQRPTESLPLITIREENNETPTVMEERVTLISDEFNVETTAEYPSTSRATTVQYGHVDLPIPTRSPEELTRTEGPRTTKTTERQRITQKLTERTRSTTRSPERIRTTSRDYTIEPLDQLFNLTEISNETSTEASELVTSIHDPMTNEMEMTTRQYRLRPMKFGNNTRPRFSVKDYKTRLDYRNRMAQTTEISPTTVVIKTKGMGKYKYSPRNSHSKIKSPSSTSGNKANETEPELRKIKNQNRLNGGYRSRGVNQTELEIEIKGEAKNSTRAEGKFIQPIRRRPQLKSPGQLAQMMKRTKTGDFVRPTKIPVNPITENLELKTEPGPIDETLKLSIEENGDTTSISQGEKINEEISESTTQEITKDQLLNSNLQSDEEAFAKASQSVADLTSSASALYNKPGMFKALSSMPYYESEHKKSFKPMFDDTSLPIEAFFHGLKQNKE